MDILLSDFNITWFNEFPPPVMLFLSSDTKRLTTIYFKNKQNTVMKFTYVT